LLSAITRHLVFSDRLVNCPDSGDRGCEKCSTSGQRQAADIQLSPDGLEIDAIGRIVTDHLDDNGDVEWNS